MTTPLIFDILIGILLLSAVVMGYHRGFVFMLLRLVVLVASYIGAWFFAKVLQKPLSQEVLIPLLQSSNKNEIQKMAEKALSVVATHLAYGILFMIMFAVIHGLLMFGVRRLKFIQDIPVVGLLNRIGGAIVGFAWNFILIFLVLTLLFMVTPQSVRDSWGLSKKAVSQTVMLKSFVQ